MNVALFAKHTLLTLTTRVAGLVLALLSSIVLARTLGPDGTGVYTLATLFPVLILTFTNLGIGPATVYYVAQDRYPLKEVFGSSIGISLILGTLSSLAGLVLVIFFPDWVFPEVARSYLILALILVPADLFSRHYVNYILLGARRIKEFNVVSMAYNSLLLVTVLGATVGLGLGVAGAIGASALSSVSLCILLFFWVGRMVGGVDVRLNRVYLRDVLGYGVQAHLGNIIAFLNYRIEVLIIGVLLPANAVGFYSIAVALVEKLWLVSQAASTVLFPVVSAEKDEQKRKAFTPLVSRNVLLITAVAAVLLFFVSRWAVVLLYSEAYLPTVRLFRILLPGTVFLSVARILANDIAGRGKPLLNTYVGLIGIIAQVGLNLAWVPLYGAAGSAWATTLSYGIVLAVRLWLYVRISGNSPVHVILPQRSDWSLYRKLARLVWMRLHKQINPKQSY